MSYHPREKKTVFQLIEALLVVCKIFYILLRGAQRRRVDLVPDVLKPVPIPVPRAITPVEVTDEQVAVGVAVYRSPEENIFAFPFFRDEGLVFKKVVQNVCVQNWFSLEFLAELGASDTTCSLGVGEV
ncbi:MAG: hypothetical protein AAB503_02915 [Patescibacteria group bacterium]